MKPFSRLSLRHPLSLLGASLATVAGILILLLLAAELTGHEVNPYFALLAILLYERQRDMWAVGAFIVAALCKESVYVLPAVLLFLGTYWKRSWRSTIPFFGAAAVLFLYRWILFGGIGGYVAGDDA